MTKDDALAIACLLVHAVHPDEEARVMFVRAVKFSEAAQEACECELRLAAILLLGPHEVDLKEELTTFAHATERINRLIMSCTKTTPYVRWEDTTRLHKTLRRLIETVQPTARWDVGTARDAVWELASELKTQEMRIRRGRQPTPKRGEGRPKNARMRELCTTARAVGLKPATLARVLVDSVLARAYFDQDHALGKELQKAGGTFDKNARAIVFDRLLERLKKFYRPEKIPVA